MNNRYARSMVAGFVATVVLSILMILKSLAGLLPQMNVIRMLAGMAHAHLGLPPSPGIGWIAHFFIGTVLWGIGFALLYQGLPGKRPLAKGLSFSLLAWALMMLIPLPMAGAGLLGLRLSPMVPLATLVLHLAWGATLGWTYGKLSARAAAT